MYGLDFHLPIMSLELFHATLQVIQQRKFNCNSWDFMLPKKVRISKVVNFTIYFKRILYHSLPYQSSPLPPLLKTKQERKVCCICLLYLILSPDFSFSFEFFSDTNSKTQWQGYSIFKMLIMPLNVRNSVDTLPCK